jgi:FkbM family methyltransferase
VTESDTVKDIWHAQTGEDRRLVELLGVRGSGFYIDVGAWEPERDSVTKWFYDRGWCGINVEPVPYYHALLERERPRDVNLCVAVTDRVGSATMTVMAGTGLSTLAEENADRQDYPRELLIVPTPTLAELCRAYVPVGVVIDFLKIDVEGSEGEVIAGGDWRHYRPTIGVVEAIDPRGAATWQAWEPMLLAHGYTFLEFDGLNRWYRDLS